MSQMGCFTGCGLLFRELEKALTKSRRVAGNRYFFLSFTANKPYDFMQPVILSTHLISSCIIYFYVLATQVTDQSHCKKNKLHDVKESPEFLNVSCGSPRFTRLCPTHLLSSVIFRIHSLLGLFKPFKLQLDATKCIILILSFPTQYLSEITSCPARSHHHFLPFSVS